MPKTTMDLLSIFPFTSFLVLSGTLTGRIIYLRKKGIRVGSKRSEKPWYLFLLYPLFALLFLVWMAELLRLGFHCPKFLLPVALTEKITHSPALEIFGVIVVSLSLLLWVITLFHFRLSLRFGRDSRNLGELITQGIFSRSRNPFFLSIDLYFLGLALIYPSPFFILMALLTLVTIHFFILKEEKFLWNHYGKTYRKYAEKTGRYL